MNGKKILGWVLEIPLILLNIATLGVGIYAALGYVPGFLISWAAPAIIGGLQILYIIGAVLISKARKDNQDTQTNTDSQQYSEEQYTAEEYNPTQ
jgi:hypothetical protein